MTKSPRPLDPESKPDDRVDNALRPQKLDDLIGQDQVKENLSILIDAARGRGEALDHVLFYYPVPGLVKQATGTKLPTAPSPECDSLGQNLRKTPNEFTNLHENF